MEQGNKMNTLADIQALRQECIAELQAKIAQLFKERAEMNARYEKEIAELQQELRRWGGDPKRAQLDEGLRLYEFLSANPGKSFSGSELRKRIDIHGAPGVVLASFVQSGRVRKTGRNRATRYEFAPRGTAAQR